MARTQRFIQAEARIVRNETGHESAPAEIIIQTSQGLGNFRRGPGGEDFPRLAEEIRSPVGPPRGAIIEEHSARPIEKGRIEFVGTADRHSRISSRSQAGDFHPR
jgi:hypothetical protein